MNAQQTRELSPEVQAAVTKLSARIRTVLDDQLDILRYPDCDGRTLYLHGTGRQSR